MPHRPLPAGFAEALGSVQRARAAKRAQKQKGEHGPPPEALSGTDTEREGDERRGDREQEQQRRQVEQDCQRRLAEDRRGEAAAAKALHSAERRERERKQAEEAEKRRLAEAEAETRRRDEEAAAAAHAQARRQAEEAARVVTEADDERDAESDELEPRSPAACASPEVAQHEHDEQSKPIEKSDLGFAKHSEAERVEGQFVEGGEERLEGQSESSAADVPPVVAPTHVEAAPTVEARVNSESLQHDSSAERDPAPDSNGGVLELRQAIKRKPNAETSAAPKAAPQPPGAASPLASSKRVRRASQDPNKLRQIQQALIGNSSRPQEEEEDRTVRLAEDLQEQAVETQEEAPANSEGEAWEDPTEEAVEDREEASVEAQEEALENPEGEAWEDWAEEAVEDQKEPSVALRLVVAPVNGVGEYQESGPREDLLQPPSPNSSKLSEDPWPDKERQYVDSPEGLDNLSEGTDPGSERASHSRATVCQAKGKVDTASETPAHHRSRPDQAFDDKPLRSPIDEALSKLAEQRRERETRKGAARDRFDRHRQSSPSPELYLDQLAESGNTVGRGHSLVHNRLVPLQSPETIRENNQRRGRALIAEADRLRVNQAKRTKQRCELEQHNKEVYSNVMKRQDADRARRERAMHDPATEQGVTKTQALFRGRLARKRAAALRKERFEDGQKIIKLQALYRGKTARKQVGQLQRQGDQPPLELSSRSMRSNPPRASSSAEKNLDHFRYNARYGYGGTVSAARQQVDRYEDVSEADTGNSGDYDQDQSSDNADSVELGRSVDDGDTEAEEDVEEEEEDEVEGEESEARGDEGSEMGRGSSMPPASSNYRPDSSMSSGRRSGHGTKTAAQRLGSMFAQLLTGGVQNLRRDKTHEGQSSGPLVSSMPQPPMHVASDVGLQRSAAAVSTPPPLIASDLATASFSRPHEGPQEQLQYSPQWSDPDVQLVDCEIADPALKFTSPYKGGLQSQGLSSNAHVSRADDAELDSVAAHEAGVMQNIYSGLEEANSILERFCNRHVNGAAESAIASHHATQWRQHVEQQLSDNEDAALPVILDAFSPNHSRTWSEDDDPEHPSYSSAPLIVDLYGSHSTSPDGNRREARQTRRRRNRMLRAPHVMCAVNSAVLAALNARPQGCVGWFMELDKDCDGFVSPQHMIDAVLLLPCRLSSDQALEFVASIPNTESDNITLSSLWIALQCPDLEHAEDDFDHDEGIVSDRLDQYTERGTGYAHYMPHLTQDQFHMEVLDMSRAAEERLAQVNRSCEHLKRLIQAEQEMIDGQFPAHLGAHLHMEERELSIALERTRDATQAECRKNQAVRKRLSLVQHQIDHWLAHRQLPQGHRPSSSKSPGVARHAGGEKHSAAGNISVSNLDTAHGDGYWPMNVTNPRAYASLSTLPSSQNLSVDPRLVQQHGPRPPGGLRFLKDHFPDRQSGGRHYHAPVEIADSASVALGGLYQDARRDHADSTPVHHTRHATVDAQGDDELETSPQLMPNSSKTSDVAKSMRSAAGRSHAKDALNKDRRGGKSQKRGSDSD